MSNTTVDPLIGRTISQYEIVARIGGGGMGVVYKASDLKLGRAVALKFLPPQWSHDEGAKQRFLREAQAASATNHRNICIIHDISHTDDGQLFIVMAHYEGQTLKRRLESGPLTEGEAVEIAAEVAEGLAKAHAQGVVHRDVKPGNLMVTDDGVKVLDFGLAKFADSLQLTAPGSTVGTVAYMSPEQARGEEADARSDVWALGVVLYEMLTGRVPFGGAYPEAIFHAIKNEPVPPVIGPDREISPAVETIVRRALDKNSERRYQSARELARDLRLVQGRTIPVDLLTGPLPPLPLLRPPEAVSWPRRIRRAVTPARAALAMVAVAAVAAGTYAWFTRPVVRILVAIAPVLNHTGAPELDPYRLALTQALIDELHDSPNIRAVRSLQLVEILRPYLMGKGDVSDRDALHALTMSTGARLIVVPTLARRDGSWIAQVEVRDADTATNASTFETEAIPSSLPKETAYRLITSLAVGIQEYFKANGPGRSYRTRPAASRPRSLDAMRAFEQGVDAYEQLEYSAALASFRRAATEDPQHAVTHAWLSRLLLLVVQKNDAVEAARRARQLVGQDTPQSETLFIDSTLAESQGDFRAAEASYRSLVRLQPDEPSAQVELADFLKRRGRNQEAVEAYHGVLRLDAGRIRPHVDLCQLYISVDERPLAEQHGEAALKAYRDRGNRPGEAQAMLCLFDALNEQGGARLAEAKRYVEQARSILESLDLPYGLSRVYQYLGLMAASEYDYRAASELFEAGLARSRQVGNRNLEALLLMNLGVAGEYLGNRRLALEYYNQSRDRYEEIGDERRAAELDVNIAVILVGYGGDREEAMRRIAAARAVLQKLGYVDFELLAAQTAAEAEMHAGRYDAARGEFFRALNIAKERQLPDRVTALRLMIAESHVLANEYEIARRLLEEILTSEAGREQPEVQIWLGRTYGRLGAVAVGERYIQQALAGIERTGRADLAPLAQTVLGELAHQSGNVSAARERYVKAASFWTDELTDPASLEARCYQGLLEVLGGRSARGVRQGLGTAVAQARKMNRADVEARCRLLLARISVLERQYDDALAVLEMMTPDGNSTIGPELRAEWHHLRGQALAGRGDRNGAEAESAAARRLITDLQAALPEEYRGSFASRVAIRSLIE